MSKKRDLWNSDDEISDEDIKISEKKRAAQVIRDPSQELFDQNFQKYIHYLKQFGTKTEEIEQRVFGDGIWYVNHPIIETSQINYQKNVGIFDMISIDKEKSNEANWIKKVLVSFTFLDNQVQKVIAVLENDLYDSLIMYGEQALGKTTQNQLPEMMTARIMGVYKKTYQLVKKLMAYIEHIVLQLHSMVNKKCSHWKPLFRNVDFSAVIDLIGKTLRAVYVIDCIVNNNGVIGTHWQAYKKLIKLAKNQPQKFGSTDRSVRKLQKTMNRYENTILSGHCMITITEITYDQTLQKSNSPLGKIQKNKELKELFEKYFNYKLKDINQNLGSKNDIDQEKKLLQLMCTYSLFRKLYVSEQLKNVWKDLWTMQKKMPIIEAHSFVFIYICIFLLKVCPLDRKPSSLEPKDQRAFITQYVSALDQNLSIQIVSLYTKFCVWLSRMQSVATSNTALNNVDRKKEGLAAVQQRVSNRIFMLCEGFNTILRLYKLLYLCFMLHINEERAISKNMLGKLVLAIQTVKASAYLLRKKAQAFDTMILSKNLAKDMYTLLSLFSQKVRAERGKQNNHKVAVYQTILQLLDTPLSQLKITWMRHALGFISDWVVNDVEIKQIRNLLKKLQIVSYNRVLVQRYQNLGFLYYAKDILPQIFQYKRQNPQTCKRMQFLFDGFEDASRLLLKCPHLDNQQQLFQDFKKLMVGAFEQNYMIPLKRNLQDFLRVQTSSMLIEKLQGVNPWVGELNDLMKMVQFEKLRIFDGVVDLKFQISESFNSSFYNLNILNMHDQQTYEMMRVMGNHFFDLKLHDVFLPNHTIERDKFDILSVVRNIPTFVSTYKYNILNQRFLQITGQNKIISCISIQQLADSIRTHGLGILSTTVNAFYKFMTTKVMAFSKFLFMEDIQNLLSRDRKWFKEYTQKQEYSGFYPYERAQHLYNQIKKLGKFEEESNYLDKFREMITTVGNSLGFIRLIRSASLHTQSKNIEYLPNRTEIAQSFEQIANKSTLGDASKAACKQLDDLLKSLQDRFSDKIDYLNLMVKAFSKIAAKDSKHLKLFYMILPALSINYVQFVTRGKEQINKKITTRAFIYDDGFVLGVAYYLTLLKQHQHFKTIHWDQATTYYFTETKKESKAAAIDAANHSAKFIEDLNIQKQLLVKKLQAMEEQFTFYNYNITSAKILFKTGSNQESKDIPKSPPSTA